MKPFIACLLTCSCPLAIAALELGARFDALTWSNTEGHHSLNIHTPTINALSAKGFPSEHAAIGIFADLYYSWDEDSGLSSPSWSIWAGGMATYYLAGHNRDGYLVEGKLGVWNPYWEEEAKTFAGLGVGYQWLKDSPFVWRIGVEYEREIPQGGRSAIGVSLVLSRRVG